MAFTEPTIGHSLPDDDSTPAYAARRPEPRPLSLNAAHDANATLRPQRLLVLLCGLAVLLVSPYVAGRIQYHLTYNELQAGVDVARPLLGELKPQLEQFMLASRMVAKRVGPSVVSIYRPGWREPLGQGSGFVVDASGFIVTNFHVVQDADQLRVRFSDGRESNAAIVGADPATDVAVLKLSTFLPNLIELEWGDSDELAVGDLVWAMGSPFGLERSITFGIVSAKQRRASSGVPSSSIYQEYLQTDAAVNPGNSGGPLVDVEGKVVGINTAIVGPSYQGISFAIPSSLAREKYEQLREKGWIERGYLGIGPTNVPATVQQRLGLNVGEGVYVGRVESGSPADRSGLRRGDVVLAWNDFPASDPTLLSRAIAATQIGTTARVLILREASRQLKGNDSPEENRAAQQEIKVTVGSHPDSRRIRF